MIRILLIAIVFFVVSGCSSFKPFQGTITEIENGIVVKEYVFKMNRSGKIVVGEMSADTKAEPIFQKTIQQGANLMLMKEFNKE